MIWFDGYFVAASRKLAKPESNHKIGCTKPVKYSAHVLCLDIERNRKGLVDTVKP